MNGQLVLTEVLLKDERRGVLATSRSLDAIVREKVVTHLIAVREDFGLKYDTYFRGVNILDACLARMPRLSQNQVELLGISCLGLASSLEELTPPYLEQYAKLSDGMYTIDDIDDMQVKSFKAVGCNASMPTEMDFLRVLTLHSNTPRSTHKLTKKLLIVASVYSTEYLPSVRVTSCAALARWAEKGSVLKDVFDIPGQVLNKCIKDLVSNFTRILRLHPWLETVTKYPIGGTSGTHTRYLINTYFKRYLEIPLVPSGHLPQSRKYLGEGSFGVVKKIVYKGDEYALKTAVSLAKDATVSQPLIREISIMLSLSHPNVVTIRHITTDLQSILLDLGQGDLEWWLGMNGPMTEELQVETAKQLLSALSYIHGRGVIHRDIKPRNIIVYQENITPTFKLSDFGSSRGGDMALDRGYFTQNICTLWYRSPEILLGSEYYGDKLDVWSMMCTLYECATDEVLFEGGNDHEQITKIFNALGKPTNTTWPGVEVLPRYSGIRGGFTTKARQAMKSSSLCSLYKRLLEAGLVLNPDDRVTSHELLDMI